MKKITIMVLCATVFLSMANAVPKNIFVDPTNGVDTQNGTTWALAVKTLDQAVNTSTGKTTNFLAGDNIYVKGGTLTYAAGFATSAANYYGSCDLSNTGTNTTRTTYDADGNGIIEPWEFLNPTIMYSNVSAGSASDIMAFTFSNANYTFNGFTMQHVGNATSTGVLRSFIVNASVSFVNNSIKYCNVSTPNRVSVGSYTLFFENKGIVSNCLFEKNSVTCIPAADGATYPFINANGAAKVSNCVIRNNYVYANWGLLANNTGVRGMLVTIIPGASGSIPALKNCVIHNNEMSFNCTTSGKTTVACGASVTMYYGTSTFDSIYNCTIANNKSINITTAGLKFQQGTAPSTGHYAVNNVCWNNQSTVSGTTTTTNISQSATLVSPTILSNNFTDGGGLANSGSVIVNADNTLSSINNSGSNQPLFKSPVINTKVGSSLGSLSPDDSTTIKQSNWKLQSSSYLINKGAYVPNSPKGVSPMDKDGKYFAISPTLPAIGAYEYVPTPVISFTQDLSTLKLGDSPVTLTSSSSAVSNAATITYTSSNTSVVSVSVSTLTVVGIGTTTVTAHQAANGYYEAAADVVQNVTVSNPLTITGITPYNGQLSVAFTNAYPADVTNYKYSTNGGSTWTACNPIQTTSPILIKTLTNGTSYNVQLKSYTTGDGLATPTTAATPNVATYLVQQGSGSSWSGSVLTGRNVVNLSTVNGGSTKSFNEWFADKSLASPTFAGAAFGTGDQVWVINGTYYLTGTVTLKAGVDIYGGFAGTELPAARAKNSSNLWDFTNVTALDGSVAGTPRVATYIGISSAFIPTTTVVDGLTIQNCTNGATNSSGGGAKIYGSGVTMQNCIVTACTATGSVATAASAGVSVLSGTLKDSYIHHNIATSSGTCAGGIAVYSDGGTVSGCKIEYNSVTGAGGGIYLYSSTSGVSITNCSFSNNSATSNGGAIASYINNSTNSSAISITGCSFTSNSSSANGGAMSLAFSGTYTNNNFNVSGCTFTSNYSTTASGNSSNGGGAICFSGSCAYTVDKCTFTGNYSTLAYGGALQITSTSSGTISNSKFNSNTAGSTTTNNGSAIYSKSNFTANNCLFADNTGINPIAFNGSSVASTFQNCTFANNLTSGGAAAPIPLVALTPAYVFSNCLFYKVSAFSNQTPTLTNCAFDIAIPTGATNSQTGVSSADFIDATNATIASRNYNLATGSRAIDAGTDLSAATSPISKDIIDVNRPQGNAYDLGAYEYSGTNLSFATKTSMSKTYGDVAFTNAATGLPSGGAIGYASGNTAVATVNTSTGEVTIVAIGTTVITATIAANGGNAAATASYTLTVAAKALTVTGATTANKVYDGTTTATITGGTLSGVVSPDVVNLTKAANYADKNAGFKAITASCSISGADAGNYTLTQPTLTSRTITAKALTMSGLSVPTSKEYDGLTTAVVTDNKVLLTAEAVGTGTAADKKPYINDEVSITGTAIGTYNSKDAGAALVTYSGLSLTGAQAGNYSLTIQTTSAVTITKKALTITADNQTVTYGTAIATVTDAGTYSATGFITDEDVTVIGGTISYSTTYTNTTTAGTSSATITPIVSSLTATNYSFAASNGTITVSKATPTLTVSNTVTFDGSAHSATATASGGGVVSNILTGGATTQTTAGTYTVTADIAASTNYNAATGVTATNSFVIDKATPTLTVSNTPVTYDGSTHSATATALGGGTVSNILTDGAATQTTAGTYTVTADIAASTNYNAATGVTATNSFVIDKASQSITFNALPTGKKVGDANFAPGATSATSGTNAITYSSSDAAVATIVSSQIHLVGAGTCTIYANQALSDNYNAATQRSQSITVTAASSTVDVTSPQNSDGLISGTTTELTVSGAGVLTVNGAGCEVKSLATATGTQVIVNSPLVVNTGGVTLAPSSTFEVANTVDVTGNVEVGAGANLKFSSANTLNITGNLILKSTDTNTENTSFSANIGTGTLAVSGNIKYLKTIDDTKWFFISFPSDVTISTITGSPALGTLGTNWFIKYYDGVQRGTSGTTLNNWKTITPTMAATTYPKLNQYQGYIIGLLSGSSEITFTLDKTVLSTETTRTIPVAANNAGAISATNHGWNLIGQPYLSQYIASNASGADSYYIYISDGTSTYTPYPSASAPNMNPMSAYFIQASSTLAGGAGISFALNGRKPAPAMVASSLSDNVQLNFTSATGTDFTNLIMSNERSTSYEIGQDLEKWIGTGTAKPQVYTVLGGINYAYNALPMSSVNNLPVGIYTQTAGSTTISVDATKAASLSKLLLTDNGVSPITVTDLLSSNYTFNAAAGTNTSRFAITAQRVVTDNNVIDNVLGETQMSIINSKLIINNLGDNSTVRVYDAIGRMVVSKTVTSNSLEIQLNARGMYTVQLQSGSTISSRKVIF